MPEIKEILYVTDRETWRAWLQENHHVKDEIWLQYYRAGSGKGRIGYNAAVEEALCFGWIDSIVKTVDEESFAQRFTPRKPNSTYSQTNKERLRRMVQQGKVIPAVVERVATILEEEFIFPDDIMDALAADNLAMKHFKEFSEPYQRIRIAFIKNARKRPDVYKKRLAHFLKMTAEGKQFGVDLEEYY